MKNRHIRFFPFAGFVLFISLTLFAFAQAGAQKAAPKAAAPQQAKSAAASNTVDVNGKKWDPHDLSGIWIRRGGSRAFGPRNSNPPLTKAGEEVIKARIPTPGYNWHPLTKKIDDPKDTNDPTFACNPKGFPRILLDTAHDYNEVVTLPDRIYQIWQESRVPRELWLDGRSVPTNEQLDSLGPTWYGHSVAHWEGDTLVVVTVGLDDRGWLDQYGFPKSFHAKVEERYKMTDPNTLTLQLTLTDPEMYTVPWVSDVKTWKKEPRKNVTWFGWYGLFSGLGELICAPMNANPYVSAGQGGD
jgi:hypothetical protein